MKEIWKDIKGYEGLYQVSNLGRIKSLKRYRKNNKSGYVQEEKILTKESYMDNCYKVGGENETSND